MLNQIICLWSRYISKNTSYLPHDSKVKNGILFYQTVPSTAYLLLKATKYRVKLFGRTLLRYKIEFEIKWNQVPSFHIKTIFDGT